MPLAVLPTPAAAQNATLINWLLVNNSRFDIDEVHLARSGAAAWGPDVLERRNGSLESGQSFTLHVSMGEWDIKLVTGNGDSCLVRHVRLSQPLTWKMTNEWLSNCVRRSGN
jgi:hypothetical protein